ncbi:MAG TPA: glycosyltransferase family 4 protein [Bryobacteraceae bacterium]|nr:glycosyltransferase family 4 protein [Bryobacteraceae bacterium]
MKIIFLTAPAVGGVFSVFRALRDELGCRGAEVRWLAAGPDAALASESLPAELACGSVVAPEDRSPAIQTAALLREIQRTGPDVVVGNVFSGIVEQNLMFYLPAAIRRFILVHNITPMTYRAARALRDHVDAAICVSPRIRHDLIMYHGFTPGRTVHIPQGIADAAFVAPRPRPESSFRVLFLGRIEEQAKGICWLAPILSNLVAAVPHATLTVAGDGPDLSRLKQEVAARGLSRSVSFLGSVEHDAVASLAAAHEAILLTSRFEGSPMSLIECMAAGCVPVASRIRGATDAIVTESENGFLFPVGDVRSAASWLARLACDPELHARLRERAIQTVREKFSAAAQSEALLALFRAHADAPARFAPLPISEWRVHPGLRPGWWYRLPEPVKNSLRILRERACCFASIL